MPQRKARGKVVAARQALYRELVLEAAVRVFADKGYDDTKVEEIAREAGIALGTLYTAFRGKAEILAAIHEAGDVELLRRAVDDVKGVEDPLDAVLAGMRAYAEYFLDHPDFLRLHLREGYAWSSAESGAGSRARTDAWRQGMEMLTRAVARAVKAGAVVPGDPALYARMLVATQQVQLAHWIESGMRRSRDEILEEMVAHARRAFATTPR